MAGCKGGTVPPPTYARVRAEDYVPVPFLPRAPPVEIVPLRPKGQTGLVWADGGWEWAGDRYRWDPGGWVVPRPGAVRARWAIVRREVDGQLFFAPSTWRDDKGNVIPAPKPLARASTRAGGSAGAGEITAPGGVRTDLDE